MKLLSAHFSNFKLLRDISLDFSVDPKRPLTVVRAENASGKTSLLVALTWAFYGTRALEDPSVRIGPVYWPIGQPCPISVDVQFDHYMPSRLRGRVQIGEKRFRLVRSITETPRDRGFDRTNDRVDLFSLSERGATSLDSPELVLDELLPKDIKDIFFTNGDAAMVFISTRAGRTTKRDQVKEAIRALLGIGLLEGSQDHLTRVKSRFTKQMADKASNVDLANLARALGEEEERSKSAAEERKNAERQIEALSRSCEMLERKLQEMLKAGDYEQLAEQRRKLFASKESFAKVADDLAEQHRELFGAESLSWFLVGDKCTAALAELEKLHQKGVIPKTAVPVLRERLEMGTCICGADLSRGSPGRMRVESLLKEQKEADADRETLTRLYYSLRSEIDDWSERGDVWGKELERCINNRMAILKNQEEVDRELENLNQKIDQIKSSGIEEIRRDYEAKRRALAAQQEQRSKAMVDERVSAGKVKELSSGVEELRALDSKLRTLGARVDVAQDLIDIIKATIEELQQVTLHKVASRMNDLFMTMVGADPKERGLYRRADIRENYEIVVETLDDRTLDPDLELNGAAQRALTFSFIWALTEISGVRAPRIIDTPLGMMSGSVKERVLELITANEDGDRELQVVLFLTRSEIAQAEDVLDRRAGKVVTLTNSAQFPVDLVNRPGVSETQILLCPCSYRQSCDLCRRKDDHKFGLARA
jgi:DNA sulfur modification protein DndD